MKGFIKNIEEETIANENFRKVLYTTKDSQLVLMNLIPKEEIGLEIHNGDQFFRFEKGEGKVIIDKKFYQDYKLSLLLEMDRKDSEKYGLYSYIGLVLSTLSVVV